MSEIRICENCGYHNPVDDLECEKCGLDLSFCIPVSEEVVAAKEESVNYSIRSMDGEAVIPINEEVLIGRDGVCSEYFDRSKYISRKHATLYFENGNVYVMDASTNGTYINGRRIDKMQKVILNKGDKITFADMDFVLEG